MNTPLDTPALVVDLNALEANIATIASTCRSQGVRWRPHVKSHAIPDIARRLQAAGANGVTCAKLGEAEIMAAAGLGDILIANQIVGEHKIARLVALGARTDVIVTVDDPANAEAIAQAAHAAGVHIGVVVEVDVGMRRAGLPPGEPAVALAHAIADLPGLRFRGFESWEGHASSIADAHAKREAVACAVGLITETAALARSQGLPAEIVSCGGTATFPQTGGFPGVTEVQVGGGIFGDRRCREISRVDMRCALTLLATVTSRPDPLRIVCDAGKKSMSEDAPGPRARDIPGVEALKLSAEHVTLTLAQRSRLAVGSTVVFEVGYSDSTIHLHDELYGVRGDEIEIVWKVGARAKAR